VNVHTPTIPTSFSAQGHDLIMTFNLKRVSQSHIINNIINIMRELTKSSKVKISPKNEKKNCTFQPVLP